MGIFKRRRLEHVTHLGQYPELPWIGDRGRAVLRYLLGRPMDNLRWTDATFWRDATSGEASRWLRLAGWKRAAVRVLLPYALLLCSVSALLHTFGATEQALKLLALHIVAGALVLLPIKLTRSVLAYGLRMPVLRRVTEQHGDGAELSRRWSVERLELVTGRLVWEQERVLPLARSLAAPLQLPRTRLHPTEVREWLSVPRDYREHGGAPVVITLPVDFGAVNERARSNLVKVAGERLGMKDPVAEWQLEGALPSLLLRAPALPPKLVTPADVLQELEQAEEYSFVLGRSGAEVLSFSLTEDSPHIALSAGSGAGKSEQIKGLIAQMLHRGWFVLVLDWKGESQEWAKGLPGVRYVTRIEKLHEAVVSMGEEVETRRMMTREERSTRCPKVLVVSEEWGITAPLLAEYWTELRAIAEPEERRTMPLRSPAITAGMKINFAGRSLGISQLLVAQRFSARVTNGNADLRESFGIVLMSRWKSQTQKMLAPDVKPFPKKVTTPGRWVAVNGDTAVVYQAVLWSDEEAREYAMSGQPNPLSPFTAPGGADDTQLPTMGDSTPSGLGNQFRHVATGRNGGPIALPAAPERQLRKLRDLADSLEPLGVTHQMLMKAARTDAQGDPDFPKAQGGNPSAGYLYDAKEVSTYWRNRRAAEAARRAIK